MQKTIVVSAVNINKGGTLTILIDALSALSQIAQNTNLRVVALVYNKQLAYFNNIEYIEIPWAKKNWICRLWCEYVTMRKISQRLASVYLWFSLHDTTPNVIAQKKVVYCHNPFLFYRWNISELFIDYKVVLFALFSKYIYKPNLKKNDFIIVQQEWIKNEFVRLFGVSVEKFIIANPSDSTFSNIDTKNYTHQDKYTFFYPTYPNSYKNIESICIAAKNLTNKFGCNAFEVLITIDGTKNRYDKMIVRKYRKTESIKFIGHKNKEEMLKLYATVDCLVFPSKLETWGLPISEFKVTMRPMLLADLPYAHTTAQGSACTAFFPPQESLKLEQMMESLICGDESFLHSVDKIEPKGKITHSWPELYNLII